MDLDIDDEIMEQERQRNYYTVSSLLEDNLYSEEELRQQTGLRVIKENINLEDVYDL